MNITKILIYFFKKLHSQSTHSDTCTAKYHIQSIFGLDLFGHMATVYNYLAYYQAIA